MLEKLLINKLLPFVIGSEILLENSDLVIWLVKGLIVVAIIALGIILFKQEK